MRVLPNFIVVGAQRCGTTWLYDSLKSQQSVYLPLERKELHFFDDNFAKGIEWYENYYKNVNDETHIGDITPKYMYDLSCAKKIRDTLGQVKIVIMLRNPVDRLVSHFGLAVRDRGYDPDGLNNFISNNPDAIERGMYYEQVKNYYEVFGQENVYLIKFDDIRKNQRVVLDNLSKFLGFKYESFTGKAKNNNDSYIPRWQWGYAKSKQLADALRRQGFDSLVESFKNSGFNKMFGRSNNKIAIDPKIKVEYQDVFKQDILNTMELTGLDLKDWLNKY
ncbi:sulfotransferase domain-containing protein [Vibrio breoganii]